MYTEGDIAMTFTVYTEPIFFFLWEWQHHMVNSKFHSAIFFQSNTAILSLHKEKIFQAFGLKICKMIILLDVLYLPTK
jgi:hypothetical protein